MTNLSDYLRDGANPQARAVLSFIQDFTIEKSWNDEAKEYDACPKVARWENCREQGYVISMRTKDYQKQLNIAFFEHRNSDSIHAIKWEETTMNSPTIETAQFKGQVYKDKYDTSFSVPYGAIVKMAKWIETELTAFWEANLPKK